MPTAIVYYSKHHGNTKKLLDAIAEKEEVTLIDAAIQPTADLSLYERIGFASGIYFGSFARQVLAFAEANLPEGKDVFYLYTHGAPGGSFLKAIRGIVKRKGCNELGAYHCRGFDTFGPFKLVGGIAKGHPTEEEIKGAAIFYQKLRRRNNQ
jgi:flavodoxin